LAGRKCGCKKASNLTIFCTAGPSCAESTDMAKVASPASPQKFLLVDAEALADGGSTPRQNWMLRPQALDSVRRLAMACKVLRERSPDTKQLVFVEEVGITQLQHCWQSGLRTGIEPSSVQCVPFGCHLVAVMLELARVRAAHGIDVAVFSNNPEVVTLSKEIDTRWKHQGFMFIEGDLILPTSIPSTVDRSLVLQNAPGVRRTIAKCQRATAGNRRAWKRKGNDMDDDSGTLPDSQIDGVPLEETPPEVGEAAAAQPAEALGAGDCLPGAAPSADQLPDAEDLYADTLVDGDPKLGLYRSMSGEVGGLAAQESKVPTDVQQALGSMPPPPVPRLVEPSPRPGSNPAASADEQQQEVGGRTRSRSPRARDRRQASTGNAAGQDEPGRLAKMSSDTPAAGQLLGQVLEADALEKALSENVMPIMNVEPTLPAVQMMDGSLQQELPATSFPEAALVGHWVRDGGRRHEVVRVPPPDGPYLEFRQTPFKTGDEKAPVKFEDNVWKLAKFQLNEARSTADELTWEELATGASRVWRRERPPVS